MPAKGTIAKYHGRYALISRSLWKKYVKETSDKISYSDFLIIIAEEIKEVRKWVMREPIGFQLPSMGNLAVNKFKPAGDFTAYIYNGGTTKIKNHNIHTGGCVFRLQWFRCSSSHQSRLAYWYFKATREFNRDLGKLLKTGSYPSYNCYSQDHFVKKNK